MPPNKSPRFTVSLTGITREEFTDALSELATKTGLEGRYGGNISALLVEIAKLPPAKRELIAILLKALVNSN